MLTRHIQTLLRGTALTVALLATTAHAQTQDDTPVVELEPVIASGSRTPVEREAVGTAVTVIDEQDIEDSQTRITSDILRRVPGVAVNRAGPVGTLTQVRIRGAEGNQTLVRIDGVEVNDVAFGSEFDFATLLATDLATIEVLRGPQSALFGSDAIGGVIDIRTRRGDGPLTVDGFVEGGSFETFVGSTRLSQGTDLYDFSAAVSGLRTGGINISDFGDEEDGASNITGSFVGAIRPTDFLEFDAAFRTTLATVQTDDQDFAFPPTPTNGLTIDSDDETEERFISGRGTALLSLFDDAWQTKLELAYTDSVADIFSDGALITETAGDRIKGTVQSTVFFDTTPFIDIGHSATFAYEIEETSFENLLPAFGIDTDVGNRENSFIGEYRLDFADRVFLSGAVRFDDNEFFEDAITGRATAAVLVHETGTRIHGSYGTGVTDPTFFELFGFDPDSFIGNPDLAPESSESFDVGVEQSFFRDRVIADITYFQAVLEDEIATVFDPVTFAATPINEEGESSRQGVEVSLFAALTDDLDLGLSYTYTDADDPDGSEEIRRAEHIGNVHLTYRFLDDRALINFDVSYNGEQQDVEFVAATPETEVTLDDFVLIDIAARYRLTDAVEVFGRIENLIDDDAEEVFSFNNTGIAGFAGLSYRLGF